MYRPRRLNHFSSNHLYKNTQCKTFENNKPTGVNKLRLRCMYNVLFMPPRNLYIFAQSGHINCMQILFLCFSKNFSVTYHLLWILLCRLCLCDLVLLAYLHKDHARINNQLYSNSLHVNYDHFTIKDCILCVCVALVWLGYAIVRQLHEYEQLLSIGNNRTHALIHKHSHTHTHSPEKAIDKIAHIVLCKQSKSENSILFSSSLLFVCHWMGTHNRYSATIISNISVFAVFFVLLDTVGHSTGDGSLVPGDLWIFSVSLWLEQEAFQCLLVHH